MTENKVHDILDIFYELEADDRKNFVKELCERYWSLICEELFMLDKCDCKKKRYIGKIR